MVVVPAGSLKSQPKFPKAAKVFLTERTDWAPSRLSCEEFEYFPDYFAD